MTRDEALQIIGVLNAAWPHNRLDDNSAIVYAGFLRDLPYDITRDAVHKLVRTNKYVPTVAELTEMVRAEMNRRPISDQLALNAPTEPATPETGRSIIDQIRSRQGWAQPSPRLEEPPAPGPPPSSGTSSPDR